MSSFFIKILALTFMIIDHIGYILFPENLIFRIIGRLAFPLFAYQLAVGYSHTKDKKKHILKLLLFAIICQLPFSLMTSLYSTETICNIIFTFVISLLIIYIIENFKFYTKKYNENTISFNHKNFLITLSLSIFLTLIVIYINVDYSWYGILLPVVFYFTLNKKHLSLICFFILILTNFIINPNFMRLLAFISLFDCVFILFFNGKRGYKFSWIFYALYFSHFLPLFLIKKYMLL